MDENQISQLFEFLEGNPVDVTCDDIPSSLSFKKDRFACKSSCNSYTPINREYVNIKIMHNDTLYYGKDALNLSSPRHLYKFDVLSSSEQDLEFNQAILAIPDDFCLPMDFNNFRMENFKYYTFDALNLSTSLFKIGNRRYIKFSMSHNLSYDFLLGTILRIAHSICFLSGKFIAAPLMLLLSDSGYLLTSSARLDLKRSYTIFDNPQSYDYIDSQAQEYYPVLTSEFIQNFIRLALENTYIFQLLCMTLENAKYNAYSDPINSFVGLEIFAQKNSSSNIIPEEWKSEIKNFRPIFIESIKQNISDTDLQNFLCKKISTFFVPINADRLEDACHAVNYPVSSDDKKILGSRNDFLHGRYTQDGLSPHEVFKALLRPHRLLCSLMAKKAGYAGYIFQYDNFIPTCQTNIPIENVFRRI